MELKLTSVRREIKLYSFVFIGIFLYIFAWKAFLIPNQIVGGGATGIAAVVYYIFGDAVPMSYTYFGINIILVIIGIRTLGSGFGMKTIFGIAVLTILLQVMPEPTIITKSFQESDKLLCAIIGGALCGFGLAIAFMNGGSAGGTDIVAMIINKYRNTTPGTVFLYADLIIIGSSFFINGDFRAIVYGYVGMAALSYTVDLVMSGNKQSVQILIFSEKYAEIAEIINNELGRGVTALHSTGWFSKKDKRVLVVLARKYELNDIFHIIKLIDPEAFISVANVRGVFGKGFDIIKTKSKLERKKKD